MLLGSKSTSRPNIKLHPNSHGSQLDIQILQHARNSHHSHLITTTPFLSLPIHPTQTRRIRLAGLARTSATSHPPTLSSSRAELPTTGLHAQEAAAFLTNVRFGVIAAVHQTVLEEERGAVGDEGVAFHFSHSNTTSLGSALDGLAGQRGDGTGGSHLEFVVDHVSQTLIVYHSNVNVRRQFFSRNARIHGFIAVIIVSGALKLMTKVFHGRFALFVFEFERRTVLSESVEGS